MRLRFAAAVLPDHVAGPCDITIGAGRIVCVSRPRGRADERFDALAIPGLVDLQVNGVDGVDFATAAPDELVRAAERLAREGLTTFLPTITSRDPSATREAVDRWVVAAPRLRRVRVPGVHLEGPFINPAAAGVHPVELTRLPNLAEWGRWRRVRMITLAPELAGATRLIRAARRRGAIAALGHARPPREAYERAVAAGALFVTHLFNAMSGLHHRDGGLAAWTLADDRVSCGLIYDRRHVSVEAARIAVRAKTPARLVLTSDRVARATPGVLSGSTSRLLDHVRWAIHDLGVGWTEAVQMASLGPARLLGLRAGMLAPGFDADIAAIRDEQVVAVWRAGARVV